MKKIIFSLTIILASLMNLHSQENVHSLYFLNEWSQRHTLNASFAPEYGYFSLPVLGGIEFGVKSNVGLSTFLYPPKDGSSEYMLFMNKQVGADEFLGKFKSDVYINQALNLNLLSIGLYILENDFVSFNFSLKEKLNVNVPKDLFRLMKEGMTQPTNHYDLKNFGIEQVNYMQAALGYSRDINSKIRVGVTAKLLMGISAEKINYNKFDVMLSDSEYKIRAEGSAEIMSGILSFEKDEDGQSDFTKIKTDFSGLIAGSGFAVDLGVTYKPIDKLTVAVAINDLGGISWKTDASQISKAVSEVSFTGFNGMDIQDMDISEQLEQMKEDLGNLVKFKDENASGNLFRGISHVANISAEYNVFSFLSLDILVGALWRNYNYGPVNVNDIVGAITVKPLSWITASGTYEITGIGGNKVGLSLNLSPKFINLYIATDYAFPKLNPQFIPIDNARVNFVLGGSIALGRGSKKDKE